MRLSLSLLLVPAAAAVTAVPAATQQAWVGPAEACDVGSGHSLVNGAILHLRTGVESSHEDETRSRLERAHGVLIEAITERGQQGNPAAWYYLGRYYQLVGDALGADSAFHRVLEQKPACADDIAYYRGLIRASVLQEAYRTWSEGKSDSAKFFFRQLLAFDPQDSRSAMEMAGIFLEEENLDSAARYVTMGAAVASDDPEDANRVKRSLRSLVAGYTAIAYESQAMVDLPGRRQTRDSLVQGIARDSAVMADMIARVEAVRNRGAQLDDESRRVFAAESTTAFGRMDAYRAELAALEPQVAADSQAAVAAAGPAIGSARTFANRYPEDVDASMSLARLLSAVGYTEELGELVGSVAANESVSATDLARIGVNLFNDGQTRAAVPLLQAALTRNRYMQNPLLVLTQAYYRLRDADNTMATARRLLAMDPLNTNSLRMMAAAWNLGGNGDSVSTYLNLANGGVRWYLAVSQFQSSGQSTVLNASVQNVAGQELPATTIVFDFLDAAGNLLYSEVAEIPILTPGNRHRISLRLEQTGAEGWKYRQQ